MSSHHRTTEWKALSATMRPRIAASLPQPCIDGCGRPVMPGDNWHLGHRVPVAVAKRMGWSMAQINAAQNLGPSHARCNTRAGGKLGATISNANRRQKERLIAW